MADYLDDTAETLYRNGRITEFDTSARLQLESDHDLDSPLLINEQYDLHTLSPSTCQHSLGSLFDTTATEASPRNQLLAATILCSLFMIAEVIGGYMAGSLAIMSDAAHLLSDCVGFAIALLAIWLSKKPPDKNMTFGYKRAEVLGAICSVLGIWLLTGILLYLAALRLWKDDYDIDANTMMIVSGIGVLFNIIMGLVLHGKCQSIAHLHSHGHHHGHSHSDGTGHHHEHGTHVRGSSNAHGTNFDMGIDRNVNINVRAAIIHVIGDLIQSCGVFIAAVIIKFYPAARIADPICTFLFSIIVLFTTIGVLRESIFILMEGAPLQGSGAIQVALLSIAGVHSVHCLNVWSITINLTVMNAHIVVDSLSNPETVLQIATTMMKNEYQISQSTFQVEKYTHFQS